jgi:hypothetical protein
MYRAKLEGKLQQKEYVFRHGGVICVLVFIAVALNQS